MESKAIINPSRDELITDFVKSNPDYYIKEFKKIGSKPTYSFSLTLSKFLASRPNSFSNLSIGCMIDLA